MPAKKVTFETVKKIGLRLPEVEYATAYGSHALKVRGKLMAGIAINKAAEPNTLFIRVDMDRRGELLAAAPDVYYMADHYAPYPCVLVRLSKIREDALPDLLGMAWRYVTANTPKKRLKPNSQ